MRKCRDRPTMIECPNILCEPCRQAARERKKAKDRENWKKWYRPKPLKTREPHKCETCETVITGKKVFCDNCAQKRQRQSQRAYEAKGHKDDPPEPPTTYDSYRALSRDAATARASGMSYGLWRANR